MARRRLAEAELKRERNRVDSAARVDKTAESVKLQIERVPEEVKKELSSAFSDYTAARDRETDALRKEVQLYRTLSTAGITTATFAHESNGGPIKVIVQATGAIERRGKALLKDEYGASLEEPVKSIRKATSSLSVLSQATLRLIDQDKRRIGRVDLHKVIKEVIRTFDPFLVGRDVEIQTQFAPGHPYLRGAEAALESVITNLINNSLAALEAASGPQRVLRVETSVDATTWCLSVSDNGPGIEGISLREIWLPGQTRRKGGTGLGLTIVRDAVSDMAGTVEARSHGELGGATFDVRLPILGV
jgi:C4-dicarboxylate-specific signal transduction histidine kinase